MAASPVPRARTISTSFIFATGLKKCMPRTRSGCFAAAAISVTDRAEVLVASTTSGGQSESRRAKVSSFRAMSSGTASMTRWAWWTAVSTLEAVTMRARAVVAASGVSLPRATPSRRSASTWARALSRALADTSKSTVSNPPTDAA